MRWPGEDGEAAWGAGLIWALKDIPAAWRCRAKGEALGRGNTGTICGWVGAASEEKYYLEGLMEFPNILLGLVSYKISWKPQGWT